MDEELLAILSQIPAAITKALVDVLVIKHPGHASQKVHGHRYGAGGDKLEAGHKRKDVVSGGAKGAESRRPSGGGTDITDPATMSHEEFSRRSGDIRAIHEERGVARLVEPIGSGKGTVLVTVPKAHAKRLGQNSGLSWVGGTDRGLVYSIPNTKEAIATAQKRFQASIPRGIKAGYFAKVPKGAKLPKVSGFSLYSPPIFGKDWSDLR